MNKSLKVLLTQICNSLNTVNVYDVKSKITNASGCTVNSAYLYVFSGRVAQLYITCTFSSNQTANVSYNIGTLNSALYPRNLAGLVSTYGAGQISNTGDISCRPQVNLNGNTTRYFASTYLLNSRYTG